MICRVPLKSKASMLISLNDWIIYEALKVKHSTCVDRILNYQICDSDKILWNNCPTLTSHLIIKENFNSYLDINWYSKIWFKGQIINYSINCWLNYLESLKTLEVFHVRGMGLAITFLLCSIELESHNHLFFECAY